MRNPDTRFSAGERAEHHRRVFGDGDSDKCAFELARNVVQHFYSWSVEWFAKEVELHHKLASVAYAQTQSVGTRIEAFESTTSIVVQRKPPAHPFAEPRTSLLEKPPQKTIIDTSSRVSRPLARSVMCTSRTSKPAA